MSIFATFKPKRYWTILFGIIGLMFIASFMEVNLPLFILFGLAMLWIFGSVIVTIWTTRWRRILAFSTGITAILGGLIAAIPSLPESIFYICVLVCAFSYATFILIAIGSISHEVFITDKVTSDRIVGSICIYLLIGMFFAFIYAALDLIDPAFFNFGLTDKPELHTFRDYLYFSYTTLTTLGYGDMTPQLPFSRLLTSFETLIGPIYLAIMVARLVGMHITQHVKRSR